MKRTINLSNKIEARPDMSLDCTTFVAFSAEPVNVANEPDNASEKRVLPIIVKPVSGDCIYIETAVLGHGIDADKALNARPNVRQARGIIVSRVPYKFSGHAFNNGGKWEFLRPETEKDFNADGSRNSMRQWERLSIRAWRADAVVCGENATRANAEKIAGILLPIVAAWAGTAEGIEALRQAQASEFYNVAQRAETEAEELRGKLSEVLSRIEAADKGFAKVGGLPPAPVPCLPCEGTGWTGGNAAQERWSDLVDAEIGPLSFSSSPAERAERRQKIEGMIAAGKRMPECATCGGSGINATATAEARARYDAERTR